MMTHLSHIPFLSDARISIGMSRPLKQTDRQTYSRVDEPVSDHPQNKKNHTVAFRLAANLSEGKPQEIMRFFVIFEQKHQQRIASMCETTSRREVPHFALAVVITGCFIKQERVDDDYDVARRDHTHSRAAKTSQLQIRKSGKNIVVLKRRLQKKNSAY